MSSVSGRAFLIWSPRLPIAILSHSSGARNPIPAPSMTMPTEVIMVGDLIQQ